MIGLDKMDKKQVKEIYKCLSDADYRLKIISPLISLPADTAKKDKQELVNRIALDAGVSVRSIYRWLDNYQANGIHGLDSKYPKTRTDSRLYIKFESLLDEASSMRRQSALISVNEIISCLEGRHPEIKGILKRSTLQRHLSALGLSRKALIQKDNTGGGEFFGRYRKSHIMEQIQGDFKEPPRDCLVDENGLPVKAYIQLWVDNCSRRILTYKVSTKQTQDVSLSSFRLLIEKYGLPDTILTDQGSVYRGHAFDHCTYSLGIKHIRSRPYQPESKGANERLNYTMDALLNQVKLVKNFKYQEFVKLFEQWVKQYNSTPHSSLIHKDAQGRITKLTPDEVFASDKRSLRIAPHDLIEHAFRVSTVRKISKDGLISFKGRLYKIPAQYGQTGQRVVIIHSTTDNKIELEVSNSQENILLGEREHLYIPLYELEVHPNIDYEDRNIKAEQSSVYNTGDFPKVPPVAERLARDIAKAEGTYISEEHFQQELPSKLLFGEKSATEADSVADTDQSLYAKQIKVEKQEN